MERRVYDCLLFNGEFHLLALRIRELTDVVHKFVVVEADTTFSGLPKAVKFTADHPAISAFASKLEFVLVEDMPDTDNAWERETWQRNAVLRGTTGASDYDLVLMSDVDEIPRVECVRQALADRQYSVFGFRMSLYYFYINYKNTSGYHNAISAVAATARFLKTCTPDDLRYSIRKGTIAARIFEKGGWHFSYMMDEAAVLEKIRSFSHQEFNQQKFLNRINLEKLITRSGDLFARPGFVWSVVEEADLPRYVLENREEFERYFAKRTYTMIWFRACAALKSQVRHAGALVWHFLKASVKGLRT